ncbi:MAG: FecCD family ABC transporter permease [Thermoplasmata archaeon]
MFENKQKYLFRINHRIGISFGISVMLLIFVSLFSLGIGSVSVPLKNTLYIFASQIPFIGNAVHLSVPLSQYRIITSLREPQIIGGILVGSTLGIGGAVVQSIFRNPITEPYIIGISSGAALGAVLTISLSLTFFGFYTMQLNAFIFSMAIVGIVYIISYRHGKVPPTYLLLIGISLSFFASSIVSFLIYTNINLEGTEYFWLLGSLQTITWDEISLLFMITSITSILIFLQRRELDALQMGEAHAHSIGVNVERSKAILIALVVLSTSAAVSITGLIGFVGLIMPHVSRLVYGGSNRYVIPSSAIFGSIFLIVANDISKVVISQETIPIGIVTGIIGVPFFIYLLNRLAKGSYVD